MADDGQDLVREDPRDAPTGRPAIVLVTLGALEG